jgi:hypothetical protein
VKLAAAINPFRGNMIARDINGPFISSETASLSVIF